MKMAEDRWLEGLDSDVAKARAAGFCCSQAVLAVGMKRLGLEDENLLRAASGFCGGGCAGVCGALEGGCALIGLYLGNGRPKEMRSGDLHGCVDELTETFRAYWKEVTCEGLIHDDDALRAARCPAFMAGTVEMVWSILQEKGVKLDARE